MELHLGPVLTAREGDVDRPYHHGDLRAVLVRIAVDLVREGGPPALTLREVGRRAGVSANAAYRHFDGLPALRQAVAEVGLGELTAAMHAELSASESALGGATTAARAAGEFIAIGTGYVRFAGEQPGLFAATFAASVPDVFFARSSNAAEHDDSPAGVLGRALRGLASAGLMSSSDIRSAATTTWAGVHGLATLLQGPLGPVTGPDRQHLVETTMGHLLRAVTNL